MKSTVNTQTLGFFIAAAAALMLGAGTVQAAAPDLTVSLTDGLSTINPGATMLYTVTIKNNGTASATGVKVSANIPTNTYFNGSANGGTVQNGNVVFPTFTLGAGATTNLQFDIGLNSSIPAGSANTISVTASAYDDGTHGADLNVADNTATDNDTINGVAASTVDLSIDITDGLASIQAGGTMLYTLTVKNLGNVDSNNVLVRALIPANTTFISADNSGTVQNGYVVYPLFSLKSGVTTFRSFTLSLNNPLPTPPPSTLSVTAYVSNDQADCNTANNCATDCDTILPGVDLRITITDNQDCTLPGAKLTYTITGCNVYTTNATGVFIQAYLPSGVTFFSASNGGTISGSTVNWNIGALNAGACVTETLVVTVNSPVPAGVTSYNMVALIGDDGTHGCDINTSDDTACDTDTLCPPDLQITQDSAGKCFLPGDQITYTLAVVDNVALSLTGVVVTDTIPVNTTFVSASNGGTFSGGVVTFPAFSLASGTTAIRTVIVSLNANAVAGTTLTNTARVSDDQTHGVDTNTANNTAVRLDCIQNSGPDVSIIKTADSNSCKYIGLQFTYTLTVSTLNSTAVTGVVVTDTLPTGLSFVSASNGGTVNGSTVTYPAFSMAGLSTVTRTLTVLVTNALPAGATSITNSANVTDDHTHGADVNLANNVSYRTDCIIYPPDLQITQDSAGKCFSPGDQITYNLAVKNNQGGALTGVLVTDTLPTGTTFVSATNGGTLNGNVVTFPAFSLAANTTAIRTIIVSLNANVVAGATLTNTAQVTDDQTHGADTNTANNTAVRMDCIQGPGPDVSIIKTADNNNCKYIGSQFTYTLTVSTLNAVAVTGVVVTDTLPAGLSFVSASDGGTVNGSTVTYPAFPLGAFSTVTRTLTVLVTNALPAGATSITNTASVTDDHTHGADINLANNVSYRTDCIIYPPDLQITQDSAGKCFSPGDQITYNLAVKNNQGGALTGVLVTDTLPAGTTFVSATNGGTVNGNVVTFPAFSLPANTTVIRTIIVSLNANVVAGTTLTNTASVTDDQTHGADTNTANNTAVRMDCTQSPGPDVAILKSATDDCKLPGVPFTYTFTISTLNSVGVTGVLVSDTLPAGLTFISASNGGSIAGGVVTYPLFSLAGNSSVTRTLTVALVNPLPAGLTTINNTATVTDDHSHGADVNPANNIAVRQDCIQLPPDLQITQDSAGKCFSPGDQITYNLSVKNNQGGPLTGVTITDTIPAATTFVSATNGGTIAGNVVTFPAFSLAANTTAIRTIVVSLNANVVIGSTLTNTASVTDDQTHGADTNTANNTAVRQDCTQLLPPDVSIVKTADLDGCKVRGTQFSYTLTISTLNSVAVTGVAVTDTLPAGLSFVSASDGGTAAGNVVTFPLFSLAGNSSTTRHLTVFVASNLPAATTSVTNTATVTDDHTHGMDSNLSNNTSIRTDCIVPPPDLQITQDSSPICFAPGAQITYTLAVQNLAAGGDTGVVIVDTLPAGVTFVSASNGGTFDGTSTVTFPAFDLAANTTVIRTINVTVNLNAAASLVNTASVSDDGKSGVDTNSANNTAIRTDCNTGNNPPDTCVVPPSIVSGPNASPVPILAGTVETFSVIVSDNGPIPATITWDFGDGTPTATGATVQHTYAVSGSYTIKVTASNPCGAVGATLQAATLPKPNPFVCNLLRAPLNLKKTNADSLLFVAQVTPAPGFKPAGKSIQFNFSNFTFNATLNSKGAFKDATHTITMKQFGSSELVTLKVVKANLKPQLAPGVAADTQAATLPGQRYLIVIGGETFGQNLDINFSADSSKGMIFK